MTLALLTLLALGQEEPAPAPVNDPGWSREGAVAGFVLAAVPVGLAVAATVSLWTRNGTAQDWLTVGAGLSAPLVALVPTFAGRSARIADEEAARKPRLLRIVGWVMTIYGAAALVVGVVSGQLIRLVTGSAMITTFEQGAWPTVLSVAGTVTTLFDGLLCAAGIVMLSVSARSSAERATEPSVQPSVAVVPMPGGGFAVMAGLGGRL